MSACAHVRLGESPQQNDATQRTGFAVTYSARPIPLAKATGNGNGHAIRSGFAKQSR